MPMTRGQKFLVGCLALIAAVILTVAISVFFFVRWVRTPGQPLEATRLLDASTAVYAEMRLRSEDPGVNEFVKSILTAMRRPRISNDALDEMPAPIRGLIGQAGSRDASDAEVKKILPIVIAVRRQESAPGMAAPPLFAASFSRMGNSVRMADWVLSFVSGHDDDLRMEKHAGEEIYAFKGRTDTIHISFVGTDALISQDLDAVKSGIDTFLAARGATGTINATGVPGASPAHALLAARPEDAFFWVASKPGFAGTVAEAIEPFAPSIAAALAPALKGSEGIKLWASIRSPDLLEGELRLTGDGATVDGAEREGAPGAPASDANRQGPADGMSGSMTVPLGKTNLDVAFEPIVPAAGETRAWKIKISGLLAALPIRIQHVEEWGAGHGKKDSPPAATPPPEAPAPPPAKTPPPKAPAVPAAERDEG